MAKLTLISKMYQYKAKQNYIVTCST
uniref:Uncharacterized protein n=1 Tax=Arundo donax TaxID=35708 RepID=A0A0A9B7C6_ARUDO